MEKEIDEMILISRKMHLNSHAPYSNFKVGAVLKGKSGKVYTGANVEFAAYGATMCAERIAIFNAIIAKEKGFEYIIITSSDDDYIVPCGTCRQVLSEIGDEKMLVICTKNDNTYIKYNLKDLLPHPFV